MTTPDTTLHLAIFFAKRIVELDQCMGYPEHDDCVYCAATRLLKNMGEEAKQ